MYKGALSSSDLSTSHHEFGLGDADRVHAKSAATCMYFCSDLSAPALAVPRRAASSANWHSVAFISFAFAVYLLYSYGPASALPSYRLYMYIYVLYSYRLV